MTNADLENLMLKVLRARKATTGILILMQGDIKQSEMVHVGNDTLPDVIDMMESLIGGLKDGADNLKLRSETKAEPDALYEQVLADFIMCRMRLRKAYDHLVKGGEPSTAKGACLASAVNHLEAASRAILEAWGNLNND